MIFGFGIMTSGMMMMMMMMASRYKEEDRDDDVDDDEEDDVPVAATHGTRGCPAIDGVCQREERRVSGSGPDHLLQETAQPSPGLQPRQRGTLAWVRLCVYMGLEERGEGGGGGGEGRGTRKEMSGSHYVLQETAQPSPGVQCGQQWTFTYVGLCLCVGRGE